MPRGTWFGQYWMRFLREDPRHVMVATTSTTTTRGRIGRFGKECSNKIPTTRMSNQCRVQNWRGALYGTCRRPTKPPATAVKQGCPEACPPPNSPETLTAKIFFMLPELHPSQVRAERSNEEVGALVSPPRADGV